MESANANFIDNILVTGTTRVEHKKNLHAVLDRTRVYGLCLKKSKCLFFNELEFLGHAISKEGIQPTQSQVKSVHDTPAPHDKQSLQSFLGMITYTAKFMPHLSQTLHLLHQLLRKNTKWQWGQKHQRAFIEAKKLLCANTMLVHYDINKPLKLFCDASPHGVGACLVHVMSNGDEHPIAYASRALTSAESNYAQIKREALAIAFAKPVPSPFATKPLPWNFQMEARNIETAPSGCSPLTMVGKLYLLSFVYKP